MNKTTRKKVLLSVLGLTLVGLAIGAGLIYRNISRHADVATVPQSSSRPDTNRTETGTSMPEASMPATPATMEARFVLAGEFRGQDAVHQSSGQARIEDSATGPLLYFENFSVTPGPDLFVYLSPNAAGQDLGEFVSLGNLKADSGNQSYNLPANYRDYKTVVIWCRAFSFTFATAELKPFQ